MAFAKPWAVSPRTLIVLAITGALVLDNIGYILPPLALYLPLLLIAVQDPAPSPQRPKAIGIIRVSTKGQTWGASPETQMKWIKSEAERLGAELIQIFHVVISGEISATDILAKLQQVTDPNLRYIIALRADRISRNVRGGDELLRKMEKRSVLLALETGILDPNEPLDRCRIIEELNDAERERIKLLRTTSRGLVQRLTEGLWPFPVTPFGLTRDRQNGTRKGAQPLEWQPGVQAMLKELCYLLYNGGTLDDALQCAKSKYNTEFTRVRLRKILNNPCYKGVVTLRDPLKKGVTHQIPFPSTKILEPDIFDALQSKLGASRKRTPSHYLSPLVVEAALEHGLAPILTILDRFRLPCAKCGRIMVMDGTTVANGTLVQKYRCPNRKCNKREKVPLAAEIKAIHGLDPWRCPGCGVVGSAVKKGGYTVVSPKEVKEQGTLHTCRMCKTQVVKISSMEIPPEETNTAQSSRRKRSKRRDKNRKTMEGQMILDQSSFLNGTDEKGPS